MNQSAEALILLLNTSLISYTIFSGSNAADEIPRFNVPLLTVPVSVSAVP